MSTGPTISAEGWISAPAPSHTSDAAENQECRCIPCRRGCPCAPSGRRPRCRRLPSSRLPRTRAAADQLRASRGTRQRRNRLPGRRYPVEDLRLEYIDAGVDRVAEDLAQPGFSRKRSTRPSASRITTPNSGGSPRTGGQAWRPALLGMEIDHRRQVDVGQDIPEMTRKRSSSSSLALSTEPAVPSGVSSSHRRDGPRAPTRLRNRCESCSRESRPSRRSPRNRVAGAGSPRARPSARWHRSMGLGWLAVSGRSLVPSPPAMITAFTRSPPHAERALAGARRAPASKRDVRGGSDETEDQSRHDRTQVTSVSTRAHVACSSPSRNNGKQHRSPNVPAFPPIPRRSVSPGAQRALRRPQRRVVRGRAQLLRARVGRHRRLQWRGQRHQHHPVGERIEDLPRVLTW